MGGRENNRKWGDSNGVETYEVKREKKLVLQQRWQVVEIKGNEIMISEQAKAFSPRAAGKGVIKVVWKGIYIDLYLEDAHAKNVSDVSQMTAVLSDFIPEPVVSKILAACLSLNFIIINRQNKGKGVVMSLLITPPTVKIIWVRSQ